MILRESSNNTFLLPVIVLLVSGNIRFREIAAMAAGLLLGSMIVPLKIML